MLSFTEKYPVQRLSKDVIAASSKVVITTIQRLYSMPGDLDRIKYGADRASHPIAAREALRDYAPGALHARPRYDGL